ncbi:YciI family protein [Frondihabitans australicus]|uniref:YCII-related domain-containing protein n=1 Tax=Frondihabitans australicus TaxID=386892 RepID=A0A495IHK4_9MICO|nr:YciI family protein [Frondihabitans australicus]RKR74576.1 hypothetical protein C8E83_1695 [Frondihabitans australicus]
MPRYFIGMYQPQGVVPSDEILGPVMRDMGAYMGELQAGGKLVFSNGFDQSAHPSVVTSDGTSIDVTPGSYLESEIQLGGFTIVDVEDEDEAHAVATRLAEITHLPIEVRLFADRP